MYLSAKSIREKQKLQVKVITKAGEISYKPLFSPTAEDRFDFIEGSAFNLSLGEIRIPDPNIPIEKMVAFIGKKKRSTPPTIPLKVRELEYEGFSFQGWKLSPHSHVHLVSNEVCNVPLYCFEPVKSRFTFAGAFANMVCSDAHPNYQGKITAKLTVGPLPLLLELGADFCFVRLGQFDSDETDAYRGIYGVEGCCGNTGGKMKRGT
jgi:deoxycytidine triphosphate deaminase